MTADVRDDDVLVLSVRPLSASAKARLETCLRGWPARWLSLAELRDLGPLGALRFLQSQRFKAALTFIGSAQESSLAPALETAAALTRSGRLGSLDAGGHISTWTRARVLRAMTRAALAVLRGAWSAAVNRIETARLLRAPRISAHATGNAVLYLKATLMPGVHSGGSVGHVAGVLNALVARGISVTYAAPEAPIGGDPKVCHQTVPPLEAYVWPPDLNEHRSSRLLVNTLRRSGPPRGCRFIYQRLTLCNIAGVLLSRAWGIPLVIEYNGSESWVRRNWGTAPTFGRLADEMETVALRHAHLVVTVSEVLAHELEARGVEARRIVWHPNGIEPGMFDPARFSDADRLHTRARAGVEADETVATFVGTFGAWHGVEVLARAVARLATHEHGWLARHRMRFVWVGDGERMAAVRSILGDEGLRWSVMLGLVGQHEAPAWLAASDVVLSPHVPNADGSRFFGSPTKLFEYMAMARGIVASDLEQVGDVLRPALKVDALPAGDPALDARERAVLHPPGDVLGLIAGLRFLVENPRWRDVLGANARQAVLQHYTWARHVDAIFDRLDALGI